MHPIVEPDGNTVVSCQQFPHGTCRYEGQGANALWGHHHFRAERHLEHVAI